MCRVHGRPSGRSCAPSVPRVHGGESGPSGDRPAANTCALRSSPSMAASSGGSASFDPGTWVFISAVGCLLIIAALVLVLALADSLDRQNNAYPPRRTVHDGHPDRADRSIGRQTGSQVNADHQAVPDDDPLEKRAELQRASGPAATSPSWPHGWRSSDPTSAPPHEPVVTGRSADCSCISAPPAARGTRPKTKWKRATSRVG